MLEKILDFIFPPSCPICKKEISEHGHICIDCFNKFDWISDPKCDICGYPFPAQLEKNLICPDCMSGKNKIDFMRSACVYDDFSRDSILALKYGGHLELKEIIAGAMVNLLAIQKPDLIIPVPLANRRLWKRGFNQATIISKPIAKKLNIKIDYDSVSRKYTPDMGHKNAKQRAKNIAGVFKIKNLDAIRGKKILLVDDVFTTGATFNELSKILKKGGATWVGGITFARVVRAI